MIQARPQDSDGITKMYAEIEVIGISLPTYQDENGQVLLVEGMGLLSDESESIQQADAKRPLSILGRGRCPFL